MDPDSFAVAVCRGEDQPAGFAGTNPQDDKFCDGGVPVGGSRPVGCIALLTGAGARLGWEVATSGAQCYIEALQAAAEIIHFKNKEN